MATPQALKAAKKQLRMVMKAKLAHIPRSLLESQSKRAFTALLNLQQYRDAKRVSVYLSMPSGEIQTDEIVRHALGAGKEVFVPYLHKNIHTEAQSEDGAGGVPKKVMDMVRLRGVEDYEGLDRDAWGIPTVTEEGVEGRDRVLGGSSVVDGRGGGVRLDLMLVPGVAFEVEEDGRGMVKRLGHGKGFYDYFLHRYRSFNKHMTENTPSTEMVIFGLALEEQLLDRGQELHILTGPYDSSLDGLILGSGQVIQTAPS